MTDTAGSSTTSRVKHFVNLTNGIEALHAVITSGTTWSFMRMQSTTIERRDWAKLFPGLGQAVPGTGPSCSCATCRTTC